MNYSLYCIGHILNQCDSFSCAGDPGVSQDKSC